MLALALGLALAPGLSDVSGETQGHLAPAKLEAALIPFVADARIVAFGESVHNSEGYMAARIAATKLLIERANARLFLLENPDARVAPLDRFLQTGDGDPAEGMKRLYWVWQSPSFAEFLRWLRRWNVEHPADRVSIRGIDPKQPVDDLERLRTWPSARAEIATLSSCLVGAESREAYDKAFDALFTEKKAVLAPERHERCDGRLRALEQAAAGDKELSEPERLSLLEALTGLRAWQDFALHWLSDNTKGARARDGGMARNAARLARLMPAGRRAVLWAHNLHISYASDRIETQDAETRGCVMGKELRGELGGGYKAVGLIGHKVGAMIPGGKPKLHEASEGSLERLLSAHGKDLFIDVEA
jgi:erythromycin esterase